MTPALWGVAAAACWGTVEFVARLSGRSIGPTNTLLGMLIVATAAVSLWVWIDGTPLIWSTAGLHWLIATGVFFAGGLLLLFASVTRGPIAVASPVVSSYPVFIVVGALILGIIPSLIQSIAIVAILAGVWIVAHFAHPEDRADGKDFRVWPTVALGLASAVIFAAGVMAGRQASEVYGELQALWFNRLFALLSLLLYMVVARTAVDLPRRWWLPLAAMGLLDTLGIFAIFIGTAGEGAPVAAATSAPVTVITVVLAAIFLRERIPLIQWAGIAIVVAGAVTLGYYG